MGRRVIPAIFASLILSGCFYQGRNFDISPVRNIRNDVTTQREIYADFGEPIRRGLENGLENWVYSYQYYELGQLRESKDLYVVFNKDNTVRSYSFTSR
jgi:SmpA / OmlA family